MRRKVLSLVILLALAGGLGTGCRLLGHVATAAVYTAATVAIISATAPPPARVEYMPAQRVGYHWVRGHWVLEQGQWTWRPGYWVTQRHGYAYYPGRWVQLSDGRWQYYPERWVAQ